MEEGIIDLKILEDEELFLGIHRLKEQFVSLFSTIANQISDQELTTFHPYPKGKKITKGNELQHCPYQVLDLVRDFDKKDGLNIRFINWWGNGLYLFVFFGIDRLPEESVFKNYTNHGFEICLTGSPWDYTGIVKHHRHTSAIQHDDLPNHTKRYHHLQLMKHIPFHSDIEQLQRHIFSEWHAMKKFHHV
ncbi:hypothetical protein FKX85_18275 [Echinicola soli]|uniref:Uncharacterized protein n=1 Tax=Echinicola soli TaxID=2591634 RepID=A0A514CM26_9BACT|nr:hypothetical protein [Echinicola soli]QDH80883.1 hypothetical protein FKX85_18275 [Echinicola soli]